MSRIPTTMAGTARFYPYSYLRTAAHVAFKAAQTNSLGSNYHRVSAVLFSAFALEAHFNHVGEERLPFWRILEPRMTWRMKLDLLGQQLGFLTDFGHRPYQTVAEVFRFRDKMAHGKTWTAEVQYPYTGLPDQDIPLDPEWLRVWWDDTRVRHVLEDADSVITTIHQQAGFDAHSVWLMGAGSFTEQ